ncbi:MAG: hypothetical protein LBU81_04580 [Methanosarcinales archaeon]|jgi:L-amino acid N-acyltransferase YncA|nr:hypothetical protein [Methanosarcinales archaeon]
MAGKFQWYKFSDVNLSDSFFDSLKEDYQEFSEWFMKKSEADENAMVFYDDEGIGAFVYLKEENEPIELETSELPARPRIKIGTLRLAERFRGQRLGEGALGVSLWRWQETKKEEIYVTVFEKHESLVSLFKRFGFKKVGINSRGESIYLKSRQDISYSNPYISFPFISPNFKKAGLIPIYDSYHDKLFPYSELKGAKTEIEEETAGNGITKIYIATPFSSMHYYVGEPVGIYRIFSGPKKQFKSVLTSYCTITKIDVVKDQNHPIITATEFIKMAGNKTIYTPETLLRIYDQNRNVVMIEMVYNGYFGQGHNINYKELSDNGLFSTYPYNLIYSPEEFIQILEMGDVDVQNVIINQS